MATEKKMMLKNFFFINYNEIAYFYLKNTQRFEDIN